MFDFELSFFDKFARFPYPWSKLISLHQQNDHLSHEKNPRILSMKYWLFNRDPYNGLVKSPHNWVDPLYTLNSKGFFIANLSYSPPLKTDRWKSTFLLGLGLFSGAMLVSIRLVKALCFRELYTCTTQNA